MHQPIQLKIKTRSRASALQITFSVALIFAIAILLTSAAPGNPKGTSRQRPLGGPVLGNYPDTSLPLSTDTTVTPDAPPTNTTSINVSTSTDFKGTIAGDPTTGLVRVTNAHPAGTYTVTVTAFDSLGQTATKTFRLTVTTPVTCTPVRFAPATNFTAGDSPQSVAVGDFNGDGKQDLATPNYNLDKVSILLGDGTGNFGAPTNFTVGDGPRSVAVGDFNGDGNQDLAVDNELSDNVSILLGDGTGHFSAPRNFGAGDLPFSVVAVGDFNGDGNQDLVIANFSPQSVSILLGDGAGHFSVSKNFRVNGFPYSVAVGDFNGDGNQDLATAGGANVSIVLGDGTGHFGAPTNFPVGLLSQSLAVGDFNGDGNQDLATANFDSDDVSILLGDGTGNFGIPTDFAAGEFPNSVAVGDFNGDGIQDLTVTEAPSGLLDFNVLILLGDGTGNFSAPTTFGVSHPPQSVAVGDFNGDGKQDLVVTAAPNISILVRDCPMSQITSAETTCSQFSSDTAETLESVQYRFDRSNHLIYRVDPRNFLYWVKVTATSGNNALSITQTITSNFHTFFAAIVNGSNVFDSDCIPLQRTITQSGNTVTVRFNAPAAGTYYIAIKFNSQNLSGQLAPNPTTVHYNLTTTGVSGSTSMLDLVKYQSP